MTPDEAKQRWCPMAREHGGNASINRSAIERSEAWSKCIADQCMMWRWYTPHASDQSGYCGLAGFGAEKCQT